jgi:crotonobetaine/carnitine-CoA ligase
MPLLLAEPVSPSERHTPLRMAVGMGTARTDLAFQERFGVKVVSIYGSTEMGFPIVSLQVAAGTGSGRLRRGYAGRIVGSDGQALPDGEVGELQVRAPSRDLMMRGYLAQPQATAAAFKGDWYCTGDAFVRTPDGAFRFVDRMRDTIRRFGENISSTALEALVLEDAQVGECCAVGVQSPLAGQDILLIVRPRQQQPIDPQRLYGRLAERLPRFMLPAYIDVVAELPKTANGKVRKPVFSNSAWRERVWASPLSPGSERIR